MKGRDGDWWEIRWEDLIREKDRQSRVEARDERRLNERWKKMQSRIGREGKGDRRDIITRDHKQEVFWAAVMRVTCGLPWQPI